MYTMCYFWSPRCKRAACEREIASRTLRRVTPRPSGAISRRPACERRHLNRRTVYYFTLAKTYFFKSPFPVSVWLHLGYFKRF